MTKCHAPTTSPCTSSTTETLQWRDIFGNAIEETDLFGNTYFDHGDWLATERVRTDTSGNFCETISSLPFGDNQVSSGSCADASPMHFTGKERDADSNLDDFGARYYSSTEGRWTSPDYSDAPVAVPYADLTNPQTLNLYALVRDNPETFADLDGHELSLMQAQEGIGDYFGTGNGSAGQSTASPANTTNAPNQPAQQQSADQSLTNVVYNESGSLRADPNAKPDAPGSAEDLANGRQAVAEIANRVTDAGHPDRVASSDLTNKAANAVKTDPHAIDAYGKSRTAADAALNGSNISNGATQYRTRVGTNVTTPVGKSSASHGTPVSQHYGPFIEGNHTVVIVIAQ